MRTPTGNLRNPGWIRGGEHSLFPPSRPRPAPFHPVQFLEPIAEYLECGRGREIYRAGDPAAYWYRVIAGMAKRSLERADGHRQIIDFLQPEDWFGASGRLTHSFAADAVVADTFVARYPRLLIAKCFEGSPLARTWLLELASQPISRLERRLLVLGRLNAVQKVAAFLLEMAARSPEGPDWVALPMTRYEIGDYLALSVETVSRSLTHWRLRGAIALRELHRIRILDAEALREGWEDLD